RATRAAMTSPPVPCGRQQVPAAPRDWVAGVSCPWLNHGAARHAPKDPGRPLWACGQAAHPVEGAGSASAGEGSLAEVLGHNFPTVAHVGVELAGRLRVNVPRSRPGTDPLHTLEPIHRYGATGQIQYLD